MRSAFPELKLPDGTVILNLFTPNYFFFKVDGAPARLALEPVTKERSKGLAMIEVHHVMTDRERDGSVQKVLPHHRMTKVSYRLGPDLKAAIVSQQKRKGITYIIVDQLTINVCIAEGVAHEKLVVPIAYSKHDRIFYADTFSSGSAIPDECWVPMRVIVEGIPTMK